MNDASASSPHEARPSPDQLHQVVVEWNATDADFPAVALVHQMFVDQVRRAPAETALIFADRQVSYGELNAAANRLAHFLVDQGLGPGDLVGICMPRSVEMIVSVLGVLKASGAYVPLDPDYPPDRLRYMSEDSGCSLILTRGQETFHSSAATPPVTVVALSEELEILRDFSDAEPDRAVSSDQPVYCIYTSGSTGRPKGVLMPHRALSNHMLWMIREFDYRPSDVFFQKTPFSFDASVWELFAPLCVGGIMVIAEPGSLLDLRGMVQTIRDHTITVLQLVPTLLQQLLGEPGFSRCDSLRLVFCGGEVLPPALVQRFYSQHSAALHNLYGPTETCIDASSWFCDPAGDLSVVPIGRPVANTQMYIIDDDGDPVGIGQTGELYIGGAQLALGYHQRPELTAERFIADPFRDVDGARLYRTGDLARWLADGSIEYLGRLDHQVKLRGFRIELGEIEAQLCCHPCITAAAVQLVGDENTDSRLVAYFICLDGQVPSVFELRSYLAQHLPGYMVPSVYEPLEKMPLTPSGKVDRQSLPAPGQQRSDCEYVAPRNEEETKIVRVWQEILTVDVVGIHDNFFILGGHSLLAARLLHKIENSFGVDFSMADIYDNPSVSGMARRVGEKLAMLNTEKAGAIDTLLDEIGAMSDDEIREALGSIPG